MNDYLKDGIEKCLREKVELQLEGKPTYIYLFDKESTTLAIKKIPISTYYHYFYSLIF